MLQVRYSKFPLGERIRFMAEKISELNFNGSLGKSRKIMKGMYLKDEKSSKTTV